VNLFSLIFALVASAYATEVYEPVIDPNPALRAIAAIESSNGKNLDHKTLVKGMHQGTKAGGRWGLMPSTVKYVIKQIPKLRPYRYLLEMDPDSISNLLNENEKIDREIATAYWIFLRRKFSKIRAAYAWYRGEGRGAKATYEDLVACEYVSKFVGVLNE
jgi:hypothetical protein